jgi:hypothetical protein
VTDLWPEEESLESRFGGVFDEAMRPTETHQEKQERMVELGEQLRAQGYPLPQTYEYLLRNRALGMLAGHLMGGGVLPECASAWLRERSLSGSSLPEEFVTHWRVCATCRAATP